MYGHQGAHPDYTLGGLPLRVLPRSSMPPPPRRRTCCPNSEHSGSASRSCTSTRSARPSSLSSSARLTPAAAATSPASSTQGAPKQAQRVEGPVLPACGVCRCQGLMARGRASHGGTCSACQAAMQTGHMTHLVMLLAAAVLGGWPACTPMVVCVPRTLSERRAHLRRRPLHDQPQRLALGFQLLGGCRCIRQAAHAAHVHHERREPCSQLCAQQRGGGRRQRWRWRCRCISHSARGCSMRSGGRGSCWRLGILPPVPRSSSSSAGGCVGLHSRLPAAGLDIHWQRWRLWRRWRRLRQL